jgi:hypothetical protein
MDWNDVIEILHHTPNLVNFDFSSYYQILAKTQPLVQLPHLVILAIETFKDPANLFDCFVVPCLHNLDTIDLLWG